ncbi:MAG TPA: hypothetical protein PK636_06305 [bacterium]|nr:hypothetical protein [bacterium]HPJ72275.1 hypothetical protein [bacterium]HPQ65342.1 hypothetical protein [bacterium]
MDSGPERRRILDWLEKRLDADRNFCLPLEKLVRELRRGLSVAPPAVDAVREWVADDPRFDLIPPPETPEGMTAEELEVAGVETGHRIGLRSRRPSPRDLAERMETETGRLIEALSMAYENRPRDGAEAGELEDRILDLLRKTRDLQSRVRQARGAT